MKQNVRELYDYRVRVEAEEPMHCEEPDDFITDYKLTLLYCPDEDGEGPWQEAGYLIAFRVRASEACEANESLYDVFDAHSIPLAEFAKAIFEDEDWELKDEIVDDFMVMTPSDILVVHICAIDPAHRGKQLGWHLMKKAVDLLAGGCELVMCKPHPLGSEQMDFLTFPKDWLVDNNILTQEKLQQYWQGMGFKRLRDSDIHAFAPHVIQPSPSFLQPAKGRIE